MEDLLLNVSRVAATLISAMAVAIVCFGAGDAFARIVWLGTSPRASHGTRKAIWRRFGMWLLLGLEFELAADIIATVVSPTWQDVGELAAIAAVRTFLNYFLEQDVERADEALRADGVIVARAAAPESGREE